MHCASTAPGRSGGGIPYVLVLAITKALRAPDYLVWHRALRAVWHASDHLHRNDPPRVEDIEAAADLLRDAISGASRRSAMN